MFLVDRFNPDVIIMDDAFQHRAIERDVDIVLINSQDQRSDHKLLPYGFLREPWIHLKRAHAIIFTKTNLMKPAPFLRSMARKSRVPRFRSVLLCGPLVSPEGEHKEILKENSALALSAVGDHGGFMRTLNSAGLNVVEELVFRDHHDYTQEDVELTQKHLLKSGAEYVVTTEKDMVKLDQLDLSRIEIYSIGIEFKLSKKAENRLLEIIKKSG
jgi:tetraacyldisaccharide 4'-kinase